MASFCSCSTNPLNTGVPSSQRNVGLPYKVVFAYLKANDGTVTAIDSGDTLDQTYFDARVNNVDVSKRWYPIGPFVNAEDTREDATFEEYNDGTRSNVRQGRRTFSGMVLDAFSKYLQVVNSFSCLNIGVYIIDRCGELYGEISADGTKLYPIPINAGSMDNLLMKSTNTEAGKVRVRFDYDMIHLDSSLRVIKKSELGGADLLRLEGLITTTVSTSSVAADGVLVALSVNYDGGPTTTATPVTGWLSADFDVYNTTTSSTVTVTGATESPDGSYDLEFAAQTPSDVLRIRSAKNGYWFETTVTVP